MALGAVVVSELVEGLLCLPGLPLPYVARQWMSGCYHMVVAVQCPRKTKQKQKAGEIPNVL